ncbi:MAG TPA: Hsp70 family protein, partial [Verrucomicrobiae bacterium]|nr:Hsp70 family protein [Verrucomicrobiae bacterium]
AHASEDQKRKEEVETRNQADSLIYQAEKTIKDFGDKADSNLVEKANAAIKDLKSALEGSDIEAIKAKSEELTKPLHELASAMYQQTGAQGAPGAEAAGGEAPKDDNVVDAEYKVVDEDNK